MNKYRDIAIPLMGAVLVLVALLGCATPGTTTSPKVDGDHSSLQEAHRIGTSAFGNLPGIPEREVDALIRVAGELVGNPANRARTDSILTRLGEMDGDAARYDSLSRKMSTNAKDSTLEDSEREKSGAMADSLHRLANMQLEGTIALFGSLLATDSTSTKVKAEYARFLVRWSSFKVVQPELSTGRNEISKVVDRLPGDHVASELLGYIELADSNWVAAAEALSRAELAYDWYRRLGSEVDSTRFASEMFRMTTARGRALVEAFRSDLALAAFDKAEQYAADSSDTSVVNSWREYINWDNGNIRNRKAFVLAMNQGASDEAYQGLLALLPKISRKKAKHEVLYRIALIESQNEQFDTALERLWVIVDEADKEAGSGIPIDSWYRNVFNDFGRAALNKSESTSTNEEKRLWLERASYISWSQQYLAQFRNGLLSRDLLQAESLLLSSLEGPLVCRDKRLAYRKLRDIANRKGDSVKRQEYQSLGSQGC